MSVGSSMAMHILQMICTDEDRPKEHIYDQETENKDQAI